MEKEHLPDKYWHCYVKLSNATRENDYTVLNDISLDTLQKGILQPWKENKPFTISGTIIRDPNQVSEIRIVHTPDSKTTYAKRHNDKKRAAGICDLATDRRLLPLEQGDDYTYELLFKGKDFKTPTEEESLIIRLCSRIKKAALILTDRRRKGKSSYTTSDEFDVQDLLHALIRGFTKYSVQEDPIGKIAGVRSSRADISIEELGILIEVKYVRNPNDQKRIFEEYSQDLVLYSKWKPLKSLLFVIYNSDDLRDPEAFEKLSGAQTINDIKFNVRVILT